MPPGRQKAEVPVTATIEIRTTLAFRNPKSSNLDYLTESLDTFTKKLVVNRDIELIDLRDQVAALFVSKNVECDHTRGKLFKASAINSCKVVPVNCNADLTSVLMKGTGLHFTVGARPPDFDGDDLLHASQDSNGVNIGFRDPPIFEAPKTGKQASKLNVDTASRIKAFVDALYGNIDSPFYHGFTSYHHGIIMMHLKTLLTGPAKDESLITDVGAGIFPDAADWGKYSPDGTWDTPQHNRNAAGVTLNRGAFKPKDGFSPPNPHLCKQQLAAKDKVDRGGGVEGGGADGGGALALQERALLQMVVSNTLMQKMVDTRLPPQQAPLALPVTQPAPAAALPAAAVLPAPAVALPAAATLPAVPPDQPVLARKRALEEAMDRSVSERKRLLDAKYSEESEIVKKVDAKTLKYYAALEKIRDQEESALLDEVI